MFAVDLVLMRRLPYHHKSINDKTRVFVMSATQIDTKGLLVRLIMLTWSFPSYPTLSPPIFPRFSLLFCIIQRLHVRRFELEVLAPLNRQVISNTPVMMSQEEIVTLPSGRKETRKRWKFAETPIMSTYLLALVRYFFLLFSHARRSCGGGVDLAICLRLTAS